MFYKFCFCTQILLTTFLFNLSACGDDSSLSGPDGTSVDYRVAVIDSLEECSQELENEKAYIEADSTWRICKSYQADTLVKWRWKKAKFTIQFVASQKKITNR